MEMEMSVEMNETVDRLAAAAGMLEAAAVRIADLERQAIELQAVSGSQALEDRLAAAELRIAELTARGSGSAVMVRKTMQAKEAGSDGLVAGLDAALTSLSLEQRIAVKSQLIRSGLLG